MDIPALKELPKSRPKPKARKSKAKKKAGTPLCLAKKKTPEVPSLPPSPTQQPQK